MEKYNISKYKPTSYNQFTSNKRRNSSIFNIMDERHYEFVGSIEIPTDTKITSYKRVIEDYLSLYKVDTDCHFVYYISYPKRILQIKELLLFKKSIITENQEQFIIEDEG